MAGGMTPGRRETLAERTANTRARQAGHGTAGAHGKRPADWADVLRDPPPRPVVGANQALLVRRTPWPAGGPPA